MEGGLGNFREALKINRTAYECPATVFKSFSSRITEHRVDKWHTDV